MCVDPDLIFRFLRCIFYLSGFITFSEIMYEKNVGMH